MSLSRRYLLKSAAAVAAGAVATNHVESRAQTPSKSPNEKLGIAMIGAGSRGREHISAYTSLPDAELLYLCDVDSKASGGMIQAVEEKQGRAPETFQDFRKALDDPRVDCVSIATPNHWHSLCAILALQAGKHVYVEKPVSHTVWEGRQLAEWARKLNMICQSGTQSRSSEALQQARKWVHDGNLGKIQYVIGLCYKRRPSIGKLDAPLQIPASIDYDLWCGPAAKVDLYRPRLHYDWHWDFNTGNGDLGNQGIHQMDLARWFLGETELSPRVISLGGRVGYDDAGNTANEQLVYHDYPKAPLLFETRGLPKKDLDYSSGKDSMDDYRGASIGNIIQCEQGYVLLTSAYRRAEAFDNDGHPIKDGSFTGGGDHFANFLNAVRNHNRELLNAEVLEGHLSSALCHTGNISYLLGQPKTGKEIEQAIGNLELFNDSFSRMAKHLAANGVDVRSPQLRLGPWLEMNPQTERFINNPAADELLTRHDRPGFVVPSAS